MLEWKDKRNWKLEVVENNYLYSDVEGVIHNGINPSLVWSELIRQAGKAERFNSDILYDWNAFNEKMEKVAVCEIDSFDMFIGIRRNGVDGTAFVEERMSNKYNYMQYFNLYWIHVEVDEEHDWQRYVNLEFYKYNM